MNRSLAVAVVMSVVVASCFVDRTTSDFECDTEDDCTDDRVCDRGYCVERDTLPCPTPCDSCSNDTCVINCTPSQPCGVVQCPEGYDCIVDCDGPSACGDVFCGAERCDVTCDGNNACGTVSCRESCACDVDCTDGTTCEDSICPIDEATNCTVDGTTESECTSSRDNCNQC